MSEQLKLIHGLNSSLRKEIKTRPLKIRGEVTFTSPSPSSRGHFADRPLPERLYRRLRKLDPEQLQIIEIVVAAIERGVP